MTTTLRLTDAQVVLLEWDRRQCAKCGRGWREYVVNADELADALETAESLSWGSDCVTAAKALVRKIERILPL